MPYKEIKQNEIFELLADQKKVLRQLAFLYLTGQIDDQKMFEILKKLSTIYQQFDLTEKLPVIKYN